MLVGGETALARMTMILTLPWLPRSCFYLVHASACVAGSKSRHGRRAAPAECDPVGCLRSNYHYCKHLHGINRLHLVPSALANNRQRYVIQLSKLSNSILSSM
jgi:hypothetical protein